MKKVRRNWDWLFVITSKLLICDWVKPAGIRNTDKVWSLYREDTVWSSVWMLATVRPFQGNHRIDPHFHHTNHLPIGKSQPSFLKI